MRSLIPDCEDVVSSTPSKDSPSATGIMIAASNAASILLLVMIASSEARDIPACGDRGLCMCSNSANQLIVDCSNFGLTEYPTDIPLNVTTLLLRGNRLTNFTSNSLGNLYVTTV